MRCVVFLVFLVGVGGLLGGAGALSAEPQTASSALLAQVSTAPPSPASAPTAPAAPSPSPAPPRFGGEIRLRGEALDNALDMYDGLDDAYQFTRMRYRLWTEAKPREELRLFFRLGGEYRWGQQGAASIRDPESRVALDNGWMEIAWPPGAHLTWRLGRQDLMYGEGFLIFDGTPADGSSSAYFDALKARWQRGAWTVDAFTAKLQDRGFGTTARDEDLHGLYAVRALDAATSVEAYALHRFKHQPTVFQAGRPWAIKSPRQETTAIGGRLAHLPPSGLQYAAEGTFQFGTYDDVDEAPAKSNNDRLGFGGYARAAWIASSPRHTAVELGALRLSGDDPKDGACQGWDPFYSEWPKWSELLIYTLYDAATRHLSESTDVGAWTNLQGGWLELRTTLWEGAGASARSTELWTAYGFKHEVHRGTLLAGKVDQTFSAGPTLQLLGERFWPGRFYDREVRYGKYDRDPAWYARLQITAGF